MASHWIVLVMTSQFVISFWGVTKAEIFLTSSVANSSHRTTVQTVTGSEGSAIQTEFMKFRYHPYERHTSLGKRRKMKPDRAYQISTNGSNVNLYGYMENSYFSLLPISALGTKYVVSSCAPFGDFRSVLVIASHSLETDVTVTMYGTNNSDVKLHLSVNTSKTYVWPHDITGTVVSSSHSVAVYSGIIDVNGRVLSYNQLIPVNHFGKKYVVAVDDNDGLYYIKIVSDQYDNRIRFQNGSVVCMGDSRLHNITLQRNESLFFRTIKPVMTTLCRSNGQYSGSAVVPPVGSYTRNSAMHLRDIIKILSDKDADVTVRRSSVDEVEIRWEEVPNTGYKVGTCKPAENEVVFISSETSRFAALAFKNEYIFNGGYRFAPNSSQTADQEMSEITECQDEDGSDESSGEDDINSGEDEVIKEETGNSEKSSYLDSLAKLDTKITDDIIKDVANVTVGLKPNSTDLKNIVDIIERRNNISNVTTQTVDNILEIYNNIVYSPDEVLAASQEDDNVANRFLQVMDTITDRLITEPGSNNSFVTDAFAAVVWDLTNVTSPGNFPLGLQISDTPTGSVNYSVQTIYADDRNEESPTHTESAVVFEEDFLRSLLTGNVGKDIRLSMNYYNNPVLFSVSQNSTQNVLKSKVISAKILVDDQEVTSLSYTNVTLTFKQSESTGVNEASLFSCVYWNFTGDENTGSWAKDGCHFEKGDNQFVCVCNHLTNFAVLLDYHGQKNLDHVLSLSIITMIGLILSIVGLSITALSHVLFGEKSLAAETRPQSTLFNLALAQLCSWIVFLVGINRTENRVGCIVVAAVLHYFILASFMWMLAMAVIYYLLLIKVVGTHTSWYMLKIGIPAWAIPVIPVVTVLAIDVNLYKGGDTFCWMSETAMYYAFAAPVGLILFINLVVYFWVVVSICKRNTAKTQNRTYIKNIKVSFLTFLVLGLCWIFGFLAISDAKVYFQYIFCITASLQGFLIFIFFTLQDQRIRDKWRICCIRAKDRFDEQRKRKLIISTLTKTTSDTSRTINFTEETF